MCRALDDASLPDECGDKLKLDFGELFDGSTRSSSPRSAPKTSVVLKHRTYRLKGVLIKRPQEYWGSQESNSKKYA